MKAVATPYGEIFVDRGPPGGNMTTERVALEVTNKESYEITQTGLKVNSDPLYVIDLEYRAQNPQRMEKPALLEIEADWQGMARLAGAGNNILGDNGILGIHADHLEIPVVNATEESLAYYGAVLLRQGDRISFPDQKFPIFVMDVGERYVENFIMTEQGGGFYLEYHLDKPHFHMLLNGGGYYILAKWNDQKRLEITAFRIQDGDAVYTKKGAIHCDAALTGKMFVGYDKAEECSTVVLRSGAKQTQVKFLGT